MKDWLSHADVRKKCTLCGREIWGSQTLKYCLPCKQKGNIKRNQEARQKVRTNK